MSICDSVFIADGRPWDQALEGIPTLVPRQNEALSSYVGNVPPPFELSTDEVEDVWSFESPELLHTATTELDLSN